MKAFIYIIIFFVFLSPVLVEGTVYQYLLLSTLVLFFLIFITKPIFIRKDILYFLPFLVFVSWVCGIVTGLINENETEYIFRNFAGFSLYLLFYIISLCKPKFRDLYFIFLICSVVYQSQAFINFDVNNLTKVERGSSISSARSFLSSSILISFPFISLWIVSKKERYNLPLSESYTYLFISLFLILIPSMSKGIFLSFMFFSLFFVLLRINKPIYVFMFGFVSSVFVGVFFFKYNIGNIVVDSYASEFSSDSIRREQFSSLVNDFKWFGNGLGAEVPVNIFRLRESEFSYGAELTYINIIHKLGVFSLIYFSLIFFTLFRIYLNLKKGKQLGHNAFSLGAMMYVIVGIGNPILLAPTFVLIHILVIYILVYPDRV